MRAPLVLPLSAAPLILAQAGRTIALGKPAAGQPDLLQIAPGETLDLSRIANETIALVKLGNRLVVLFQDRSYVVVDGLYLPDGNFTPNVRVAVDNATTIDTAQFTSQFGVSSDEQLLTAAGISVGPRGAGGVNLAAAPPSSALNPESSLTPDTSGPSSTFGALTQDDAGTTTTDTAAATTSNTLLVTPTPATDTASVTESGVAGGNTPTAGTQSATGNVLTNDTGATALAVTGVAAGTVATAVGNVGTVVTGTFGTLIIAADGTYTYTLDNADTDTQALAQGSAGSDVFSYTVTDANGLTATTTVTVVVTGANDVPVITSGTAAASGTAIETGFNVPGIAASGTLVAGDVDNGAALSWSGSTAGALGAFAINATTGAWTYTLNNTAADSLAQGETRTETFTATVTDEFGATATQLVAVTINGTNDAPVVTSSAAAATGSVAETNFSEGLTSVNGTLTASDVDTGASLAWSGSAAGSLGAFAINATTGVWTYTLDNKAADSLAQGETRTETFTATVTDEFGATATQLVTITIAGANDRPIITSGAATGSVIETGLNVPGTATATGTLTASDVDTGATLSWSGSAAGTFGAFAINATTGAWTYTLDNKAADSLAQGQTRTESFAATVTDEFGATSTQFVTLTVNGTNDAPIIISDAAAATGSVTETGLNAGVPVPGTPTATGTLTASDVDTGATLLWSGDAAGTYGSFVIDPNTGTWTYTIDEKAAQSLVSGQTVTETFSTTVTDEFGAATTQIVTITINGADDTTALTFDLDSTTAGTGYAGTSATEAAISQSSIPGLVTNLGVSLAQTDESSALDPRPNDITLSLTNPADRITAITLSLDAEATGSSGVLRVSSGFLTLPTPDSITTNDTAHTLQIAYASGYSQADAVSLLSTLRYVNTDTSFLLDTSDRTITITLTDQNGGTSSAVATIPVIADVTDFSGAAGINAFTGGHLSDHIIGLDGNDILNGGAGGNDYIDGGADDDTITAGDGNNILLGGAGDNSITAGNGDNTISGTNGTNIILVGNGANQITLGNGDSIVTVGDGNNVISVADGGNTVTAGDGANQITLGYGDNVVTAGDGGNTVTSGAGSDTIQTGNGNDVINAGDGGNTVTSGGGSDTITAGQGDDTINAGAGSDRITAGGGDDDITTGSGGDTIVYNATLAQIGFDTLRDFESGSDTLEFAQSVIGGGLATGGGDSGALDSSRFVTGSSFSSTDQRFRFDSNSNVLFYDADGSGAGQAEIALALVETGNIVASDIRIA